MIDIKEGPKNKSHNDEPNEKRPNNYIQGFSTPNENCYTVTLSKKDLQLSPEKAAKIESIHRWLEDSKKTLGPTIFGGPRQHNIVSYISESTEIKDKPEPPKDRMIKYPDISKLELVLFLSCLSVGITTIVYLILFGWL
jgi:hypothetical protein